MKIAYLYMYVGGVKKTMSLRYPRRLVAVGSMTHQSSLSPSPSPSPSPSSVSGILGGQAGNMLTPVSCMRDVLDLPDGSELAKQTRNL